MGVIDWLSGLGIPQAPQIAGLRSVKFRKGGSFSVTGQVRSVAGGTETVPGRTVLAGGTVPSGCTLVLERWSANVIDIGNSNQIYFAILRNGAAISFNLARVSGEIFSSQQILDMQETVMSGVIQIVAYNISGMATTIEPNALDAAVAVQCQAWFTGTLMSEERG